MKVVVAARIGLAVLALAGCASTKVKPKDLADASAKAASQSLADMSCEDLDAARGALTEQALGAAVKPTAVDFTSASDLPKAKELNATGAALSVGMTAIKSIIPGAGFAPLITGSAQREAKRADAIMRANLVMAKIDGVMIGKRCPGADSGESAANDPAN